MIVRRKKYKHKTQGIRAKLTIKHHHKHKMVSNTCDTKRKRKNKGTTQPQGRKTDKRHHAKHTMQNGKKNQTKKLKITTNKKPKTTNTNTQPQEESTQKKHFPYSNLITPRNTTQQHFAWVCQAIKMRNLHHRWHRSNRKHTPRGVLAPNQISMIF